MTKNTLYFLCSLVLGLSLTSSLSAGPVWLCSIVDGVSVESDGTTGPIVLGDLEPPTFLRVDSDGKEVTLLAPESRRGEVTVIDAVHRGEGCWIMTGLEHDRAWSLMISDKGHMTLSVTSDGATWSVFGNAMREDS
jgi:hypothetical protein